MVYVSSHNVTLYRSFDIEYLFESPNFDDEYEDDVDDDFAFVMCKSDCFSNVQSKELKIINVNVYFMIV